MKRNSNYIILMIIFLLFLFQDSIIHVMNNKYSDSFTYDIKDNSSILLNELEQTLDIAKDNNNYILTKVMYRNIYDFKEELTIYKGKDYNINNKSAVVNKDGLVGIIKHSYKSKSVVQLITNKNTEISVRINDSYGILKSNNQGLYVSNITNNEVINVNDAVYTSGIGHLPKELLVGYVDSVKKDNLGIEQLLYIKPAADLNNLNYLMVIT